MKKILFIFVLGFLALSFKSFSQILVNSNGYVGINQTTPAYNLDWYGTGRFWSGWGQLIFDNSGASGTVNIHPYEDWVGGLGNANKRFNEVYAFHVIAEQVTETSDEKVKENIRNLENSLDKIKKIRGVTYDMKKDFYKVTDQTIQNDLYNKGKNKIGFLAQELEKVFPEMVFYDANNDSYSVRYSSMIPVLVEALKEQQNIIEELTARIETIEADCCNSKLKSASLTNGTDVEPDQQIAMLYQNNPNPFKEQTNIRCFIPRNSIESWVNIYDLNGIQLEQFQIKGEGDQFLTVPGSKFKPGMYLYSLIIDGREINTKRMILTK